MTKKDIDNYLAIVLGLFAIGALWTIFENDESKIVSKKGKEYLSNDNKMKELSKKLENLSEHENQREILM